MKDYYYELKYKDGDGEVQYSFNADIDVYKLQEHLERFLSSCGWDKTLLKELFQDNSDIID